MDWHKISKHSLIGKNTLAFTDFERNSRNSSFVTLLISENCDETKTTTNCRWRYSNGAESTMIKKQKDTLYANNGLIKVQEYETTITEKNYMGEWLSRRFIREIVKSRVHDNGTILDSQEYIINYEFRDGTETKEVLKYFYHPIKDKKVLKAMSWTKYAESYLISPHDIAYHAVLVYNQYGEAERGFADSWAAGQKAVNFLDWQKRRGPLNALNKEVWYQWEKWIRTGFLHVYLV